MDVGRGDQSTCPVSTQWSMLSLPLDFLVLYLHTSDLQPPCYLDHKGMCDQQPLAFPNTPYHHTTQPHFFTSIETSMTPQMAQISSWLPQINHYTIKYYPNQLKLCHFYDEALFHIPVPASPIPTTTTITTTTPTKVMCKKNQGVVDNPQISTQIQYIQALCLLRSQVNLIFFQNHVKVNRLLISGSIASTNDNHYDDDIQAQCPLPSTPNNNHQDTDTFLHHLSEINDQAVRDIKLNRYYLLGPSPNSRFQQYKTNIAMTHSSRECINGNQLLPTISTASHHTTNFAPTKQDHLQINNNAAQTKILSTWLDRFDIITKNTPKTPTCKRTIDSIRCGNKDLCILPLPTSYLSNGRDLRLISSPHRIIINECLGVIVKVISLSDKTIYHVDDGSGILSSVVWHSTSILSKYEQEYFANVERQRIHKKNYRKDLIQRHQNDNLSMDVHQISISAYPIIQTRSMQLHENQYTPRQNQLPKFYGAVSASKIDHSTSSVTNIVLPLGTIVRVVGALVPTTFGIELKVNTLNVLLFPPKWSLYWDHFAMIKDNEEDMQEQKNRETFFSLSRPSNIIGASHHLFDINTHVGNSLSQNEHISISLARIYLQSLKPISTTQLQTNLFLFPVTPRLIHHLDNFGDIIHNGTNRAGFVDSKDKKNNNNNTDFLLDMDRALQLEPILPPECSLDHIIAVRAPHGNVNHLNMATLTSPYSTPNHVGIVVIDDDDDGNGNDNDDDYDDWFNHDTSYNSMILTEEQIGRDFLRFHNSLNHQYHPSAQLQRDFLHKTIQTDTSQSPNGSLPISQDVGVGGEHGSNNGQLHIPPRTKHNHIDDITHRIQGTLNSIPPPLNTMQHETNPPPIASTLLSYLLDPKLVINSIEPFDLVPKLLGLVMVGLFAHATLSQTIFSSAQKASFHPLTQPQASQHIPINSNSPPTLLYVEMLGDLLKEDDEASPSIVSRILPTTAFLPHQTASKCYYFCLCRHFLSSIHPHYYLPKDSSPPKQSSRSSFPIPANHCLKCLRCLNCAHYFAPPGSLHHDYYSNTYSNFSSDLGTRAELKENDNSIITMNQDSPCNVESPVWLPVNVLSTLVPTTLTLKYPPLPIPHGPSHPILPLTNDIIKEVPTSEDAHSANNRAPMDKGQEVNDNESTYKTNILDFLPSSSQLPLSSTHLLILLSIHYSNIIKAKLSLSVGIHDTDEQEDKSMGTVQTPQSSTFTLPLLSESHKRRFLQFDSQRTHEYRTYLDRFTQLYDSQLSTDENRVCFYCKLSYVISPSSPLPTLNVLPDLSHVLLTRAHEYVQLSLDMGHKIGPFNHKTETRRSSLPYRFSLSFNSIISSPTIAQYPEGLNPSARCTVFQQDDGLGQPEIWSSHHPFVPLNFSQELCLAKTVNPLVNKPLYSKVLNETHSASHITFFSTHYSTIVDLITTILTNTYQEFLSQCQLKTVFHYHTRGHQLEGILTQYLTNPKQLVFYHSTPPEPHVIITTENPTCHQEGSTGLCTLPYLPFLDPSSQATPSSLLTLIFEYLNATHCLHNISPFQRSLYHNSNIKGSIDKADVMIWDAVPTVWMYLITKILLLMRYQGDIFILYNNEIKEYSFGINPVSV